MPVVTVTAPALEPVERERAALVSVTSGIADALGLRPADVYATAVPSRTGVLGTQDASWAVVALHGSRRDRGAMDAAAEAARTAVAAAWQVSPDAVWVQWLVAELP